MIILIHALYISVIPADPQTLRSDKERQVNSFVIVMNCNRVYLFIDGDYVNHMQSHGFSGLLDYRKFIQYASADYGELVHGWYILGTLRKKGILEHIGPKKAGKWVIHK